MRYQDVLAKMSAKELSNRSDQLSSESIPNVSDGWIYEEDEGEEAKDNRTVKSQSVGPLLGGFADAETVE